MGWDIDNLTVVDRPAQVLVCGAKSLHLTVSSDGDANGDIPILGIFNSLRELTITSE